MIWVARFGCGGVATSLTTKKKPITWKFRQKSENWAVILWQIDRVSVDNFIMGDLIGDYWSLLAQQTLIILFAFVIVNIKLQGLGVQIQWGFHFSKQTTTVQCYRMALKTLDGLWEPGIEVGVCLCVCAYETSTFGLGPCVISLQREQTDAERWEAAKKSTNRWVIASKHRELNIVISMSIFSTSVSVLLKLQFN